MIIIVILIVMMHLRGDNSYIKDCNKSIKRPARASRPMSPSRRPGCGWWRKISLSLSLYIYIYIHAHAYVYIYIYMYVYI